MNEMRGTIAGFTGTRQGMTELQQEKLESVFQERKVWCLHHGDCVGADAEAHDLARVMGLFVVTHPPIDDKHRAFREGNITNRPLEYLTRNQAIVRETALLIAAPKEMLEVTRSGTWATYRYAIRKGKPTIIIYPDGVTERR